MISRITLGIILKRPIEPSPLIRGQGSTLLQPPYQIRVTGEQTTEEEGIVAAGLQHAPGVFVVPATGWEEGGWAEDLAEAVEVDVAEAPAFEEFVFFFVAEDLLVALFCLLVYI